MRVAKACLVLFFMQQSIFFGSMLCFVIVLRNFAGRNISLKTWFDAIVFVAGGILLYYAWCNIAEIYFSVNLLNHIYVPFVYFMGPATYIGFFLTVDVEFQFTRARLLYFAPGAVLLAALPFLAVINPSLFVHRPMDFFKGQPPTLLEYLLIGGFSLNLVYYLPIFRRTSLLFNFQALKTQLAARILLGIYAVTTGITALIIAAFALRSNFWLYLAATLTAYLATLVHIFRRFSPELFEQIQVAIEKGRVSRLEGIDQKQLHFELIELMTSEKLYMDDSLTLAKLAEELDIKPHQLSEFLNRYMGMNFNRFINHLRIEKAVKLLLESPGTNILDVAFECGFKSKAAFNAAFSSFKGMPPTKYIEQKRRSLPAESPES
ncbi:MAG: helix-turn-helix domain-containing protein [Turneriella sp.]